MSGKPRASLPVDDLIRAGYKPIRAGHGVLVLRDQSGVCVRVVASADCRAWLSKHLGATTKCGVGGSGQNESESARTEPARTEPGRTEAGRPSQSGLDSGGRPVVDLRPIVDSVECHESGSMLQSELDWIELSSALRPDLISDAISRVKLWCVVASRVDGQRSDGPLRLRAAPYQGAACSVGPFSSRSAAERFAEAVGLVTGVSRSPSVLRDAEEIAAHEHAVHAGLGLDAEDLRAFGDEAERFMREASAEQDYESAGSWKSVTELVRSAAEAPGAWVVGRDFRWLGILSGVGRGAVRPVVFSGTGWRLLPERDHEQLDGSVVIEADEAAQAANDAAEDVGLLVIDAALRAMRDHDRWFRLGSSERIGLEALKRAAGCAVERSG